MSSTFGRFGARVTRPIAAATLILALAVASIVPVVFATPAAAVSSTGGSARFPEVQWVSWGANGASLIPDANGKITRTESMTVGGQQIVVTCVLSNLKQPTGADHTAPLHQGLRERSVARRWAGRPVQPRRHRNREHDGRRNSAACTMVMRSRSTLAAAQRSSSVQRARPWRSPEWCWRTPSRR